MGLLSNEDMKQQKNRHTNFSNWSNKGASKTLHTPTNRGNHRLEHVIKISKVESFNNGMQLESTFDHHMNKYTKQMVIFDESVHIKNAVTS
jgi:hypothetical protein